MTNRFFFSASLSWRKNTEGSNRNIICCFFQMGQHEIDEKMISSNFQWILVPRGYLKPYCGHRIKGQLISKCLFGVINSSKKRTKTILRYHSSKVEFFVRFLGELKIPKRHFEINWPLVQSRLVWSIFKFEILNAFPQTFFYQGMSAVC